MGLEKYHLNLPTTLAGGLIVNPKEGGSEVIYPALFVLVFLAGLLIGVVVYWFKKRG